MVFSGQSATTSGDANNYKNINDNTELQLRHQRKQTNVNEYIKHKKISSLPFMRIKLMSIIYFSRRYLVFMWQRPTPMSDSSTNCLVKHMVGQWFSAVIILVAADTRSLDSFGWNGVALLPLHSLALSAYNCLSNVG